MRIIPLGNTDVHVSAICLGTMYFGNRIDKSLSFQLLDQYYNAGGMFIDTANIYSFWLPGFVGGESETLIGNWINERNNRSNLFVATKMGFAYGDVKKGLSSKQIILECEKSLKRLRIDTIDLYYAHGDDYYTPIVETIEAFDRLVKQGKVRYIGASNFHVWRLHESRLISQAQKISEYCCIQQRYSYVRPKPFSTFEYSQVAATDDILNYCNLTGVSLIAYSILLNGAYTDKNKSFPNQYLGQETSTRILVLESIAKEIGATTNQVLISWMINSTPQIIPIVSASNQAQMQENLKSLEISLSQSQLNRLNQVSMHVQEI